jgi:hypothetical protein
MNQYDFTTKNYYYFKDNNNVDCGIVEFISRTNKYLFTVYSNIYIFDNEAKTKEIHAYILDYFKNLKLDRNIVVYNAIERLSTVV